MYRIQLCTRTTVLPTRVVSALGSFVCTGSWEDANRKHTGIEDSAKPKCTPQTQIRSNARVRSALGNASRGNAPHLWSGANGCTHVVLVYLGWAFPHIPQESGLHDGYISVQNCVVEPYVGPSAAFHHRKRQLGRVELQAVLR